MTEFYRNYLAVAVLILAAIGMVVFMLGVGRLIRPSRAQGEKYIPYEAGSDPTGMFGQSNVRYYVFALLFVIFDVEVMYLFPWGVAFNSLGLASLIKMVIFIAFLLVGLAYAWKKGALTWE